MLYLRTLGALRLDCPADTPGGTVHQRRPLTLLAYLAVAGPAGVPRERLLDVFWPDTDIDSARGALKQHVFGLRKATGESELILGRDQVRLNPNLIRSDIDDFVAAATSGRTEDLLELYRGPFLDGVQGSAAFEAWVGRERRRFAEMFEAALDQRVIELGADDTSEPSIRPFMKTHAQRQLGDRARAVGYMAIGAALGIIALLVGIAVHKPAPRYSTMLEVFEARMRAHQNDKRPRGRLFIGTPIDQTGRDDLKPVLERIDGVLRGVTGSIADVVVIPGDSVRAIERAVSAKPGLQSAADRLGRANSSLNVMTTYAIRGDSMNITVTLQRAVFPSIAVSDVRERPTFFKPAANLLRQISSTSRKRSPSIENWPIASYNTGIEKPNMGVAASRLARALRAMRSCKLSDHVEHELTPWCWRRENELELIDGYFDVRHPPTLNP